MTFRELLRERHPDAIDDDYVGGCFGCPKDWGMEADTGKCPTERPADCMACWDREAPETEAADEHL